MRLAAGQSPGPTLSSAGALKPAPAAAGRRRGQAQPRVGSQAGPARLLLAAGGAALGAAPRPGLREARSAGGWRAGAAGGARQRGGDQSRRAGGGAPKGEKESAAESKRLIGGRLAGSGSPGSALARLTERSSVGRPCHSSHWFSAPALLPEKGESLAVVRARRNHLPTESQGGRTPENRLVQPSYFPEGQTEAQSEAAAGIDHTAS